MTRIAIIKIIASTLIALLPIRSATGQDSAKETQIVEQLELNNPGVIDILYNNYKKIPRETCIGYVKKSLPLLNGNGSSEQLAKGYLLMGILLKHTGLYDSALHYCDTALRIYEQTNDNQGIINANLNIGIVYKNLSNYSKSLEYANKALSLSIQTGDSAMAAGALGNIGSVYLDCGDYEKALQYQLKCLWLHERINGQFVANDLNNIGNIYNISGNYLEGIHYYRRAASLFETSGDIGYQANALYNAGSAFNELLMTDSALFYVDRALALWSQVDNKLGSTYALNLLGKIQLRLGNYEKAESSLKTSLGIMAKMGNASGVSYAQMDLGELYILKGETDSASVYLNKSLAIADTLKNLTLLCSVYKDLFNLSLSLKDSASALHYNLKYVAIRDSIFNQDKDRNIAEMKTKYETALKDRENMDLKKDLEIARKKRLYYIINLIVLSALLLMLAIILILATKSNKQKKLLLEQEYRLLDQEREIAETKNRALGEIVELKNKEMVCISMAQAQKNEFLKTIVDKLNHNQITSSRKYKVKIYQVINQLKRNIDDEIWQDFETRFQQVHQSFYNNLNAKYPDLTPNEKKLCAFLKLNMSTKEIAGITSSTTKSVDIARSRLRNKIDLERNENLSIFMQQF